MTKAKIFSSLIKPFIGMGIGNISIVSEAYKVIVPLLLGGTKGIVDFGSFKMQIIPNRRISDVITLFMFNGKYESATTGIFQKLLVPGDVVIDIGANIGYFSLLAGSIVGVTGRVLSFEPETNNMEALCRNISLNGFKNIYPARFAISDYSGISEFHVSINDPAHSLIKTGVHSSTVPVMVNTLDRLVLEDNIKLIKTDTEGNELAVLRGAESVIRKSEDISLIIEVNTAITSAKELLDYVRFLGMEVFYIINDYNDTVVFCEGLDHLEKESNNPSFYVNLLCMRQATYGRHFGT